MVEQVQRIRTQVVAFEEKVLMHAKVSAEGDEVLSVVS